jgi:hypothetical protein
LIQRRDSGKWSIAVINRSEAELPISLVSPEMGNADLRKYEYQVKAVPQTEEGDLQAPSGTIAVKSGQFSDHVKGLSLTVYTGLYDNEPPAAVEDLRAERMRYAPSGQQEMDAQHLAWKASASADVIYYRIFYDGQRIGSTVAAEYVDGDVRRVPGHKYTVAAVDSSGNASATRECEVGPRR